HFLGRKSARSKRSSALSEPHALGSERSIALSEPHALGFERSSALSEPHALGSERSIAATPFACDDHASDRPRRTQSPTHINHPTHDGTPRPCRALRDARGE